jgi:hypothetical protein
MNPAEYAAKLRETARLCADGTLSIADLFDVQRPIWLEVLEAGLQEAVLRELDDGGVEWIPVREPKAPGRRARAEAVSR